MNDTETNLESSGYTFTPHILPVIRDTASAGATRTQMCAYFSLPYPFEIWKASHETVMNEQNMHCYTNSGERESKIISAYPKGQTKKWWKFMFFSLLPVSFISQAYNKNTRISITAES